MPSTCAQCVLDTQTSHVSSVERTLRLGRPWKYSALWRTEWSGLRYSTLIWLDGQSNRLFRTYCLKRDHVCPVTRSAARQFASLVMRVRLFCFSMLSITIPILLPSLASSFEGMLPFMTSSSVFIYLFIKWWPARHSYVELLNEVRSPLHRDQLLAQFLDRFNTYFREWLGKTRRLLWGLDRSASAAFQRSLLMDYWKLKHRSQLGADLNGLKIKSLGASCLLYCTSLAFHEPLSG